MNYRNGRMPSDHKPPPPQRCRIVEALGSKDAAVAWMTLHTMAEAATEFAVSHDAVKVWEKKLGARCKRTCFACRKPWAYADMHINAKGEAKRCKQCVATPKVILKGREAELAEYRLIPDTIYRWLRVPISSDTGYWPIYATRGEA